MEAPLLTRRIQCLVAISLLLTAALTRAEDPVTRPTTRPHSVEETRRDFLALIDRPKVDPAAEIDEKKADGAFSRYRFTYASEAGQRVPGILLAKDSILTDGQHHSAVIVLHGTTGKKEDELDILRLMAAKDLIAVSIDGRYHGERGNPAAYNAAIAQAYTDGKSHPLYLDTVWDVMRLIDYLQSRPDVDADRIGLMGISKGGMETWMTTAVDPRVRVAIPCISLHSFEWDCEHDAWKNRVGTFQKGFDAISKSAGVTEPNGDFARQVLERLIPGICGEFDGPQMIALISPRPLMMINGDKDPLNRIDSVHLCETAALAAYQHAGSPEKFQLDWEKDTAHAMTKQAKADAADWFQKWLTPSH